MYEKYAMIFHTCLNNNNNNNNKKKKKKKKMKKQKKKQKKKKMKMEHCVIPTWAILLSA